MDLLLAGFAGVLIGALTATAILLHVFQKRADRDLIERRLRACCDYRDFLVGLEGAFTESNGDARVIEQAWLQVGAFTREFRRTSWLFGPELRLRLEAIVAELEHERRSDAGNGDGAGGRAAQLLCEKGREIEGVIAREIDVQTREHRRLRFLPGNGSRGET